MWFWSDIRFLSHLPSPRDLLLDLHHACPKLDKRFTQSRQSLRAKATPLHQQILPQPVNTKIKHSTSCSTTVASQSKHKSSDQEPANHQNA
jgi:hypothetical protein